MNPTQRLNLTTAVTASTFFTAACYTCYRLSSITFPSSQARVVSKICELAVISLFASSLGARYRSANVSDYFKKFASLTAINAVCLTASAIVALGCLSYPKTAMFAIRTVAICALPILMSIVI